MTVALKNKRGLVHDNADRTATQVRNGIKGSVVHGVRSSTFTPAAGHTYETRCRQVLHAAKGAILTTRDVGCADCIGG